MLRREESRLLQRTESAEAARRAAVEARAALVAENVELLVGDVEAGLLDTLAEAPAENLDAVLNDWERTNPLVRTAFRAAAGSGRLLRPVQNGSEEARGFYRRFAARLSQQPPWRTGEYKAKESAQRAQVFAQAELDSIKKLEQNVSSRNLARKEVQALAKDRPQDAIDLSRKFPASHLARVTRAGLIEFAYENQTSPLKGDDIVEAARRAIERETLITYSDFKKGTGSLATRSKPTLSSSTVTKTFLPSVSLGVPSKGNLAQLFCCS